MHWRLKRLLRPFEVRLLGTITSVETREPAAALTFDDGPHPDFTPRLLEVLERHGARATFFMVGVAARRYPHVVAAVAAAGHAIGNHSWDHPSFPLIPASARREQIRLCRKVLAPHGRALFRPPYGDQTRQTRLDALLLGQQVVTWSLTTYDWTNPVPELMARRLDAEVRPGDILLFHDALHTTSDDRFSDRTPMLRGLDMFLAAARGRFRFLALPELLRLGRPRYRVWLQAADRAWLAEQRLSSYRAEVMT